MIVLLCVASWEHAQAQRSRVTKSRQNFSTPSVKGHKAKLICPVFVDSRYPFHSLGLKFGDPFALTYKFYARKKLSFALDFGKAASGLYSDYFRGKFIEYAVEEVPEGGLSYIAHRVTTDLVGEVKALYQFDASRITEGLQFYAGAGWEWKQTSLAYDYSYDSGTSPTGDPFGNFRRNRTAMGPEVVAGIEYSYFTMPVSVFMEVEYFADILLDRGWTRFQGGVGLRYVF